MPSGMPASCVIRASWPPPTMPTTGNVTPPGYRPWNRPLPGARFPRPFPHWTAPGPPPCPGCELPHRHCQGVLVSMAEPGNSDRRSTHYRLFRTGQQPADHRHDTDRTERRGPHTMGSTSSGPHTKPHGALRRRIDLLVREVVKFGAVGGVGLLVNLAVFNLVRHTTDLQVVRASVIATVVAIAFNYVGFRYFTYRDRDKSGRTKELSLFLLFSAVGLVIENGVALRGHVRLRLGQPAAVQHLQVPRHRHRDALPVLVVPHVGVPGPPGPRGGGERGIVPRSGARPPVGGDGQAPLRGSAPQGARGCINVRLRRVGASNHEPPAVAALRPGATARPRTPPVPDRRATERPHHRTTAPPNDRMTERLSY